MARLRGRLNVALKVALLRTGKKQQTVARLIGCEPSELSHIVHGRRPCPAHLQAALGKVLALPVDEVAALFPQEENQP